MSMFQTPDDLFSYFPYVAGAQGDHKVAPPERAQKVIHYLLPLGDEGDVLVPKLFDTFIERLAGYAGDGLFPRGIDVHDDELVRLVEGGKEFFEQVLGPRIPVRLEHHDHPPLEPSRGGRERGPDLRGVMAVIVDDDDSAGLSFDLKPSLHAGKFPERLPDDLEIDVQLPSHGDRSQAVADIVNAGHRKLKVAQVLGVVHDSERGPEGPE